MSLQQSNGLKGAVTVSTDGGITDIIVGGLSNWNKGADARNEVSVPITFGADRDEVMLTTKQVLTISGSGVYDPDDADGQGFLREAYNNETQLGPGEIKIFTNRDEEIYWTPTTGSYVLISSVDGMSQDASGFASWEFAGVVIGDLEIFGEASA